MSLSFKVPIKNLFYMLSYANRMPDLRESLAEVEDDLITYDFLVELFLKEVRYIVSRGTTKNYLAKVEETSTPSGRILFSESIGPIMWRRPSLVCEKDEYTEDILFNQIMKSTLQALYQNTGISGKLRRASYLLTEQLFHVQTIPLVQQVFTTIHFNRHNLYYQKMINLAHLLFTLQLLSHKQGDWTLYTANISDQELSNIFERFLFYFYQREQEHYKARRERFTWDLSGNEYLLPRMETDISLTHRFKNEKIIIDAKFYEDIFQWNFGKPSFRSSNMYQMFAYIHHQPSNHKVRGILVYPYNGRHVKEEYLYTDKATLEMRTIDLSASWDTIKKDLLSFLK